MMRLILAAAVVVTALSFNTAPARAAGYAPWCAVFTFGRGDAQWDCQYASIEQCRPVILSGNRGFCNPNPAWRASVEPRKHRHHKRRKHQ